jgi:hypothetical protein
MRAISSHTVRWWRGRKGPGWYNVAGERLTADVFDAWFPPQPAPPAWCKVARRLPHGQPG